MASAKWKRRREHKRAGESLDCIDPHDVTPLSAISLDLVHLFSLQERMSKYRCFILSSFSPPSPYALHTPPLIDSQDALGFSRLGHLRDAILSARNSLLGKRLITYWLV